MSDRYLLGGINKNAFDASAMTAVDLRARMKRYAGPHKLTIADGTMWHEVEVFFAEEYAWPLVEDFARISIGDERLTHPTLSEVREAWGRQRKWYRRLWRKLRKALTGR